MIALINIEPCFFGESKSLFGIYSPPISLHPGPAVLIPHLPFNDQSRLTWMITRVAKSLCESGCHVFRFDLFGSGNSHGRSEELSIQIWQDNLVTAREELVALAGNREVKVVGIRFIASLASHLPESFGDELVCFDPLFSGVLYLEQLKKMRSHIKDLTVDRDQLEKFEYAGFLISKEFVDEIHSYTAQSSKIAKSTVIADHHPGVTCRKYVQTPTPFLWDQLESPMAYPHEAASELHKEIVSAS